MARKDDTPVFKQHQKVVAAHDLPGIAGGTKGKILLINGLSWVRYRVLFEGPDGRVERGMLSADDLTTPDAWAAQEREAQAVQRAAEREARRAEVAAGAVAAGTPGSDLEGSAA